MSYRTKPLGKILEGRRVVAKLNSGRYKGTVLKFFPYTEQGPMYQVEVEGNPILVRPIMLREYQLDIDDEEEEVRHG